MAILDLISHVYPPSFVNMLPKYLKHSTFSTYLHIIIKKFGGMNNWLVFYFGEQICNKVFFIAYEQLRVFCWPRAPHPSKRRHYNPL